LCSKDNWLRLVGLVLLALLLQRIDVCQLVTVLARTSPLALGAAILLNIPQVFLRAFRWRWLLRSQQTRYGIWPAMLSYFGSIFIGLLTPGRLGEFVKAMHVNMDCHMPMGQAFSSVLADRLFDLYALLVVGGMALLSLTAWQDSNMVLGLALLALLLTLPLAMFLHQGVFARIQILGSHLGRLGRWLFAPQSWLLELRNGLRQLSLLWLLAAMGLTVLAYAIFFSQCYLLALVLGLKTSFVQVSFAVAMGSLVTLLPVSIAGLGTREAVIVAYLGIVGVPVETALGFSLMLFITFYVAGGLMGAVAWCTKPAMMS
jgi:uncharacterized protein (TIRG00374 family)